jgi:CubicO group peptidase (beta-lactamase class C family)
MPLQDYIQKNIWDPLRMNSMTFSPKTKPGCMDKLVDMSIRIGGIDPIFGLAADPEGKVEYIDDHIWNLETPGTSAGAGAFGNVVDYQKLLQSLCADDEKLLKRSTVEEMFKPQLTEASRKALMETLAIPQLNQPLSGLPMGTQVDYGLGGLLIMEDLPGARRKGTMSWGGYPNLLWFCDRKAGVSGIYGGQIFAPGDLKSQQLFGEWEKELYKKVGKEKL